MSCKGVVLALPPAGAVLTGREVAAGMPRIANRPIVCHVLEGLRETGIRELALAVPPEALEEVRQSVTEECDLDVDITYLATDGRRDLRSTLAAIEPFVGDDPCLIRTADGVGQPLTAVDAVMADGSPDLVLFLHRGCECSPPLGAAAERLLGIAELDSSKSALGFAGVCFFGPRALRRACTALSPAEPVDLVTVAERLAGLGGRVDVRHLRPWRCYHGAPLDLLEMNRIVLDQLTSDSEVFEGNGNRIEGRVVIHPTAEVSESVILGPVVIGSGARIANAYIGPYTSVGRGVHVEGAEVERSIVADGAKIMHVSDRIDASTVGRDARIFRDFCLPRGLRMHVGDGVELALN
jgi:glucose-1-phosphate thymidylyltransferase